MCDGPLFKRIVCLTLKQTYYKIVLPTKALLHQESTGKKIMEKRAYFIKSKVAFGLLSQTFKGINLLESI